MNFKQTLEKIESSEIFKLFKSKNPDAEFCAGFFMIDIETVIDKTLDYKLRDKIFTFTIDDNGNIIMNEDNLINIETGPKLTKIISEPKIEINELKGIVGIEALEQGINEKFQKIIAVLQNYKDKNNEQEKLIWNLTCILDKLIILHALIDAETGIIIKFEKKDITDIMKLK